MKLTAATSTLLLAGLALGAAPAAADSVSLFSGSGNGRVRVEDLSSQPRTDATAIEGPGGDLLHLSSPDHAEAALDYDYQRTPTSATFTVATRNDSGRTLGSAAAKLHFLLTAAAPTRFELSVSPGETGGALPVAYTARFNDAVADWYLDREQPGGVGGSIGIDGMFAASGVLAPGSYDFSVNSFASTTKNTRVKGSGLAKLSLTAAAPSAAMLQVPLPSATMMGLTLFASFVSATALRRPARSR